MSNELKYLAMRAATGALDRRAFMGRAAALGVSTAMAGSLLSSAAYAAGPNKGGLIKAGLGGGESTNSSIQQRSQVRYPSHLVAVGAIH